MNNFTKRDYFVLSGLAVMILFAGIFLGNALQNQKINNALIEKDLYVCNPEAMSIYYPNTGINDLDTLYNIPVEQINYSGITIIPGDSR